ncbi:POK9 protein, partial [Tachuris rubrigastra]|nr:POK9 protein [Tachuris rubrigastra]
MGALQPGLPNPAMIPEDWYILIIDLKDCFFTISLHPEDTKQNNKFLAARKSHSLFHQNAQGLQKQFQISITGARAILRACPECSDHNSGVGIGGGVNPRGTKANEIWQM